MKWDKWAPICIDQDHIIIHSASSNIKSAVDGFNMKPSVWPNSKILLGKIDYGWVDFRNLDRRLGHVEMEVPGGSAATKPDLKNAGWVANIRDSRSHEAGVLDWE